MVSMAGFDLPVPVVRKYIASAITLVIHLARLREIRSTQREDLTIPIVSGPFKSAH